METSYEKQAKEFLEKTNTKLTIAFSHKGKHFAGDKEQRNIYNVKLSNKNHTYVFQFGDSINNTRLYETAKSIAEQSKYRLKPYDILACLQIDYSEDFTDFCSEFGYEEHDFDNKKNSFLNEESFTTYKAVQKESDNLKILFTEEELELLHEIQ